MEFTRRQLLGGVAGYASVSHAAAWAEAGTVTPEEFGARGDGLTNDTLAFARMSESVNARGGGQIVFRRTTYIVGRQLRGGREGYAFYPSPIMDFRGCSAPLVLRGNGARLRCAPGLRYGTFDPSTGQSIPRAMPYVRAGELASPYKAMIRVEDCSGPVEIGDLELDGNLSALIRGGPYGDAGWQIPAVGIHLVNNIGLEHVSRIYSHDHALDGILIDGADRRSATSTLKSVRSEYNGRQGCSITGGRNYSFADCRFERTGAAGISSPPGAGVDIEAEAGKQIRNLNFLRCIFSANAGPGMVADGGDTSGATFDGCTFIGSVNWAAWPNKPNFRFLLCSFVGSIVHAFGDNDPRRACQFHDCTFQDDPALSPDGQVYGGDNPSRPIADLPDNKNVRFDHCDFALTHRSVLPWTTNVTIFENCRLSQQSSIQSYPRGTFIGRNVIVGNVDLYSARIEGPLILNGGSLG